MCLGRGLAHRAAPIRRLWFPLPQAALGGGLLRRPGMAASRKSMAAWPPPEGICGHNSANLVNLGPTDAAASPQEALNSRLRRQIPYATESEINIASLGSGNSRSPFAIDSRLPWLEGSSGRGALHWMRFLVGTRDQ